MGSAAIRGLGAATGAAREGSGCGMGQGCDQDVTGLSRPQAEAADPAGAGELAEEEEGVPGHQGHPGQAGAAQQTQGTAGLGRAWACSPSSSTSGGSHSSLKFLGKGRVVGPLREEVPEHRGWAGIVFGVPRGS